MRAHAVQETRILGMALSSHGLGFALLEGDGLVDWGMKGIKGKDKNSQCLAKAKHLVSVYCPDVIVLESALVKVRRASRIQELHRTIIGIIAKSGIKAISLPRGEIREIFFAGGKATKHDVAAVLARRFPKELGVHLPQKRKPWMSEDHRMAMFEAVASVMAFRWQQRNRHRKWV